MASFFILKCDLSCDAKRVPIAKESCRHGSPLVVQCQFPLAVPGSSQQGGSPKGGNSYLQVWVSSLTHRVSSTSFGFLKTLCAPHPHPVHTPFRQSTFTSERWSFEQFPSVAVPSPPLKLKVWSTDWRRGRIIWELVRNEELGPSPRPTETESAF